MLLGHLFIHKSVITALVSKLNTRLSLRGSIKLLLDSLLIFLPSHITIVTRYFYLDSLAVMLRFCHVGLEKYHALDLFFKDKLFMLK